MYLAQMFNFYLFIFFKHLQKKNLQLCNQKMFSWTYSPKTDKTLCHHVSSGLSGWALFNIHRVCCLFCKSHLFSRRFKQKKKILRITSSAVTFALSFDFPLPLSQPSSPDKKEPLLRCFARHYKTVAMDTQSEQAPHTGSGIGNDRCNISHFKKRK